MKKTKAAPMLEFADALEKLKQATLPYQQTEVETLSLSMLVGRVLAEDIRSTINVPPADNSAMDGYAIHTSSVSALPTTLNVSQKIAAGSKPAQLAPGTAARIFTGANIPKGANCVVIQENCDSDATTVTLNSGVSERGNIRKLGQDIKSNEIIFNKGRRVKAQDIGLLASIGIQSALVYKRIRVAILSTGNELIQPGNALKEGQIYDSNRPMVETICRELCCDISASIHIQDNLKTTTDALTQLSKTSDMIISCGGVSVGDEDHLKQAVSNIGALALWKVKIKPGKPIAFGEISRDKQKPCLFLGLPGNPVSAFVTLHLFGKLVISVMQGMSKNITSEFEYKADFTTTGNNKRPEFLRVKCTQNGLTPYSNQSSGVLSSVCWADALAFIPENTAINEGDTLKVYPI